MERWRGRSLTESCRSYDQAMNRLERTVEGIHAASLAVWLSALVGAGLAAAVVFPVMRDLDPRLPGYASYTGEHWMIAAGHVGRRVFSIADRAQLVVSAVAVVSLAVATRLGLSGGVWLAIRWIAVGVAASLAVYNGLVLAPAMDQDLTTYWAAAREGDGAKAAQYKAAFSAAHPHASMVLQVGAASVLVGVISAAASRGSRRPSV